MALKLDIGPRVLVSGPAVSALTFTPPSDREVLITRIYVSSPSAADTWTVGVGGREIMRDQMLLVGNNQLFGGLAGQYPRNHNIFEWYYRVFGDYLSIPVPRGQTITIASVGGATANIVLMGIELTPNSIQAGMVNHYEGNHFILPIGAYLNANLAAAVDTLLDTESKPAWVPSMLIGNSLRLGWRAKLLALFLEAASVNTFSGAANHVSSTDHLAVQLNGEQLFSHVLPGQTTGPMVTVTTVPAGNIVTPGGIPLLTGAAAAGSANAVYTNQPQAFPPFQMMQEEPCVLLDPPPTLSGMDTLALYLGVRGDVTGGAAYAGATQKVLVELYKDMS